VSTVEPSARPDLDPVQVRVLGALVEKELTTPQQYPLTLNALTLACNQTSNRDPVVAYDEATVELAVRTLKQQGLTRFVHPTHGRSVLRYEQRLREVLGLDDRQLAVLAVLLLRGPQTVGELRSRTERMAEFDDLGEVVHELELLADQAGGLVAPVPRRAGQKEGRYAHLLGSADGEVDAGPAPGAPLTGETDGGPVDPPAGGTPPSVGAELDGLRREVAELRRRLDEVRSELGMDDRDG
jgi:uncharacterized protein YceH (UPF0502 family)